MGNCCGGSGGSQELEEDMDPVSSRASNMSDKFIEEPYMVMSRES